MSNDRILSNVDQDIYISVNRGCSCSDLGKSDVSIMGDKVVRLGKAAVLLATSSRLSRDVE